MKPFISFILLFCFLAMSGCTNFGGSARSSDFKIRNYTQEDILVAKIANEKTLESLSTLFAEINGENFINVSNIVAEASESSELADDFLNRSIHLIGLPSENQNKVVENLLSTNKTARIKEGAIQFLKENSEESLIKKNKKAEERLLIYGETYERERNDKIKFWAKITIGALALIGGPIALLIIFPPLASGLIGMFPVLMKVFQVVPKSTFERTVKGVGEFRKNLKWERDNGLHEKERRPIDILKTFDSTVKESTDFKDKIIIDLIRKKTKN